MFQKTTTWLPKPLDFHGPSTKKPAASLQGTSCAPCTRRGKAEGGTKWEGQSLGSLGSSCVQKHLPKTRSGLLPPRLSSPKLLNCHCFLTFSKGFRSFSLPSEKLALVAFRDYVKIPSQKVVGSGNQKYTYLRDRSFQIHLAVICRPRGPHHKNQTKNNKQKNTYPKRPLIKVQHFVGLMINSVKKAKGVRVYIRLHPAGQLRNRLKTRICLRIPPQKKKDNP